MSKWVFPTSIIRMLLINWIRLLFYSCKFKIHIRLLNFGDKPYFLLFSVIIVCYTWWSFWRLSVIFGSKDKMSESCLWGWDFINTLYPRNIWNNVLTFNKHIEIDKQQVYSLKQTNLFLAMKVILAHLQTLEKC